MLNLEVDTYRNDLLDIEDLVRSAVAKHNPEAIHDAVQKLVALNEEWVARQRDAVRVMAEKRAELGAHADLGNHLEAAAARAISGDRGTLPGHRLVRSEDRRRSG